MSDPMKSPANCQSLIWQHVKTGGLYELVETKAMMRADITAVVIYRSLFDGQLWVRPHAEFFDGRFRNLSIDEVAGNLT